MLAHVRKLYEAKGLDAIWKWAMEPDGAHSKAKRFAVLGHFAGNRADHEDGDERKAWKDRQESYRKEREKFEERYEAQQDDKERWPEDIQVAELLYHAPGPHVHFASPERDKLIDIFVIAQNRGIRVGEFHEAAAGLLDVIECVHTSISWHYRDSSNPFVGRVCSNRGDGCAGDLNDADGGSDLEYAFYIECRRRYL